jgi:lipopolysaccharide exporter
MEDVRNQMARGAIWMVAFKLFDRSIGLLSTLILARLLTPENFGVVAMATSFIALLELIGAFGFDMALIQRRDATREHYDTAWTFSVLLGCVLCVALLALSVPIAKFYRNDQLIPVICTLAVGSLLQGFQNVGVVAFRKEMQFDKEFRFLATKKLVTFPLTVTLAFLLRNYWALVIGMTAGRLVDLLLSYRFHPYRPKFCLSAASDLLHFSKWLLLLNVLQFLRDRSSDFVIGRIAGPRALGLFSNSYELANMPGTELVAPINRAVYPAYARIASDKTALQREYLSVMGMICLLAIPAVAGMAATANLVVPLVLGDKWLDAVPILQILAFFGISQVMQSNAYALFLALGRGDIFARINGTYVTLLITALLLLVPRYGVTGGAYAYLFAALLTLPLGIGVILHQLQLSLTRFAKEVWRPLLASAAVFGIVNAYSGDVPLTTTFVPLMWITCRAIALGIATYVVAIALFWWLAGRPASSAESVIFARVRARFKSSVNVPSA